MKTLQDVLDGKSSLLEKVLCHGNEGGYSRVEMDGVIVIDDQPLYDRLLADYLTQTHFAPGMLPGIGLGIGDYHLREENTYLTVNLAVAWANVCIFHLARTLEPLLVSWRDNLSSYQDRVVAFLHEAAQNQIGQRNFKKYLGKDPEAWRDSHLGMSYAGLPQPFFVLALQQFADSATADPELAQKALILAQELVPYRDLIISLQEIRHEFRHHGVPKAGADYLLLSSPAASGGAAWYHASSGEDLSTCLPGAGCAIMVGAQVGQGIADFHVGSGSLKGSAHLYCLPSDPIAACQAAIDSSHDLKTLWAEIMDEGPSADNYEPWNKATSPIVREIVRPFVQDIIGNQVLGFEYNLAQTRGTAYLRPIISRSYWSQCVGLIAQHGLDVREMPIAKCLGEDRRNLYIIDRIFTG